MKAAKEAKLIKATKPFSEAMTYFEKKRCTDPGEAKKKCAPAAEQVGEGGVASGANLHPHEGKRLD